MVNPDGPALDRVLAERLVAALYRHLLGREPDPAGLAAWTASLMHDRDVDRLIADFTAEEEFRQVRLSEVWKSASSAESLPGATDADPATLRRLFEKTARYWREAGRNPGEVYFSALTADRNRTRFDADRIRHFLRKGEKVVDRLAGILAQARGKPFAEASCLDFGCGVGRLTFAAARRFGRVYGVDFSRGHLDELSRNLAVVDAALAPRIETIHLETPDDLAALPTVDYCISVLTLQHNPPPVIAGLVKALLQRLAPGGAAALHLPIHHPFYRFDLEDYLASDAAGTAMEMHVLPREDLRACVAAAGGTIRDSFGTGYTKGIYSEIFLITRS